MTPEDVRTALATPPDSPPPPAPGDLPPEKRDDVLANIAASYFTLRRGMAVAAFALPVALWLLGGVAEPQRSISAYYHRTGATRDVLVGTLWAIGSFLFFYRGYSRKEDRALDGAGVLAIVVSLAPVDWPGGAARTLTGTIHAAAAIGFFLLIAYVCVFRSGDTLAHLGDEPRRERFRATYRVLGAAMVAAPLTVWLLDRAFPTENSLAILLIEVAAVYTFAAFWWIKSREIAAIERQ